jgi:hypothetical protein
MITKIFPHTTPIFLTEDGQAVAEESPILISQVIQDDSFHTKWGAGAIYRYGQSDTHGCNHCRLRGDIHFMRNHECTGKK